MKRTVFITGTSSGLGKATARLFQSEGWHVVAAMRHPAAEKELGQLPNVTLVKLDIANAAEIKSQIEKVLIGHSIDVVINNAGYGLIGPLEALGDAEMVQQIETNLLGTIRVTKAFVGHFRRQGRGTIINISSMFGWMGYPTCSLYTATKFAIEGFSESLAYELGYLGIGVKTVSPGGIRTDFAGRSLQTATHPSYQALIDKVSEGYSPEQVEKFASPEAIAAVIYEAATDGRKQLRYVAGNDAIAFYEAREANGTESHFRSILDNFKI